VDYSRLSMSLREAIFTQHSIRRFKRDPIPIADVRLVQSGTVSVAPSGPPDCVHPVTAGYEMANGR
jgi:hypothetical protein